MYQAVYTRPAPRNTAGGLPITKPIVLSATASAVARREKPIVVLTGANGYIGRHLTTALLAEGFHVRALVRTPAALTPREGMAAFPYRLEEPPTPAVFEDAAAVVHAAFDASGAVSEEADLAAANSLLAHARRCGAKFVFLSSIEARPGGASAYAHRKRAIERAVLAQEGVVVRPGLVYGGNAGGLFATVDNVAKRAPVIPAFLPAPRVQPIHVADLCRGICRCVSHGALAGGDEPAVYTLAQSRSLTLTAFLRQLAWQRHRRLLPAVWLPLAAARLLVNSATVLRLLPRRYSARLQGLFALHTKAADAAATDCARLGVEPVPLAKGLGRGNGRHRAVLEEANALTRYVAGRRPAAATLAHYAKAVAAKRDGQALGLPVLCRAFPPTIRCIDPHQLGARRNPELSWRLDAALALCEVDVRLAPVFHTRTARSWLGAICELAVHTVLELLLAPLSLAIRWPNRPADKNPH